MISEDETKGRPNASGTTVTIIDMIENEETGAFEVTEDANDGEGDGEPAQDEIAEVKAQDEDDDEWGEDEPEMGVSDPFLSKLFTNFMLNYKPTHAYDSVIREITARLGDNVYHRKWIGTYAEMLEAYRVAHPENKFALTREAFTPDDIISFAQQANRAIHLAEFPIATSTRTLAEILELTPVETLFLQLAIKMSANMAYQFHAMFEQFRYSELGENPERLFAQLFDKTEDEIKVAMKGFLFQSGLLSVSDSRHKPFYYVNQDMREAFCSPHITEASLTEQLFPSNMSTELTPDDYRHLKTEIERAERVIQHGLDTSQRGVNLMFWGIPGTGKTELALMLAQRNGWQLRVIGDISDADNKEKSRAERLVSLKIALKIYGRDKNTVLLFDEMEDLFKMDTNAAFSKAFINRIIETTTVPIIWTTNDLEVCGDAVLRRIIWNIAMEVPPVDARRAIWQRYTDKYALGIDADTLDDLAETYDTAPALIHNAAKITSMAGLGSKDVPDVVQSLDRLIHYGRKRKFLERIRQDDTYDLSCVNSESNLESLTDCLCSAKPGFSLLLYGPPGTGKSEYGRHVAKRLNKRFMFKRASDLISKWVGETEALIAAAFEKAAKDEALLLIDEGDTFLRNREGAEHSWEVSQVNEMLSQMERHPQPFILTTNLFAQLDAAAMRRFTFKMKFDFLRPEQSVKLFRRYFDCEAPYAIERMSILTPGDFAAVKKRADIIRVTDAHKLLDMLGEECDVKPQKSSRVGF